MPGLILLDMRMPGMNGWEFAREFRARHGRAAGIVVVTAAENARARAAEAEAGGWLWKPWRIDDVLRIVAGHAALPLGRGRRRRALRGAHRRASGASRKSKPKRSRSVPEMALRARAPRSPRVSFRIVTTATSTIAPSGTT